LQHYYNHILLTNLRGGVTVALAQAAAAHIARQCLFNRKTLSMKP
jgi:hypothetical protein